MIEFVVLVLVNLLAFVFSYKIRKLEAQVKNLNDVVRELSDSHGLSFYEDLK